MGIEAEPIAETGVLGIIRGGKAWEGGNIGANNANSHIYLNGVQILDGEAHNGGNIAINVRANKILEIKAEWEAGAKTEDTFAELAKKYTNDSNGDEGGLYDDVYPGWAVEEFDAWCFDENRKPGDVDVVSTEYGCHLIYFVQENEETYREYMITTDLRAKDSEEWYTGLRDAYKNVAIIGDTSLIKTDIILANS